jgi:hypothetical protein
MITWVLLIEIRERTLTGKRRRQRPRLRHRLRRKSVDDGSAALLSEGRTDSPVSEGRWNRRRTSVAEKEDWLDRSSAPLPTLVLRCKVYIENEWPCADAFLSKMFYLQVEDDVVNGHTLFSTSTNSTELVVLNAISVLLHFVLDESSMEDSESTLENSEMKAENSGMKGEGKHGRVRHERGSDVSAEEAWRVSLARVERAASEYFASAHGAQNAINLAPYSLIYQIPR